MLEEYILTTDGEKYVDVNSVREALGIKDDENIFRAIEKLKEERERYKSNCDYFAGIAQDRLRDRNKLELELRQALGTVDEYADIPGLVRKLKEERDNLKDNLRTTEHALEAVTEHELKTVKQERDELKDRLRTYRLIANGIYGDSCGYSASKQPAFRCNVISYSWNFGTIAPYSLMDEPSYTLHNDSIRVELELTPTANYKGTFDLEDLKKYIQDYGREKKLGVVESVDYQNAKTARAELAYLYKTVLGKEKLDRDLSPHEVMKAILDEYRRRKYFIRELACSLGFGNPVVNLDNIDQKEKDILERVEKLKDDVWPCENSVTFAEYLRKEFPKFCKEYNVAPLTKGGSVHNWIQYIFDALDEYRTLANNNFNKVEGLRKEKRAVENSLAELRAKIREIYCSVVDDEWDEYLAYTSALNDINEEYKRVVHNFEERTADWSKAQQELDRYRLAVGSLLDIPKEIRDDINAIERAFTFSKKQYASLKEFRDNVCEILDIPSSMADDQEQILKEIRDFADRYYELRYFRGDICEVLGIDADELFGSPQQNDKYILEQAEKMKKTPNQDAFRYAICNALNMPTTVIDGNVIGRIHMMQDCYDKLCKDYTELRKAIWDAMDRKPETLPEETARLAGEVAELARGEKLLIEFRDAVAKAIGITYPTTNNFLLTRVSDIYKEWGEAHDLAMELDRKCIDLTAKNSDLQQKFEFQSGLRQQWHVRYESEHERANGEHKRAEKLRSDITALKNHIELLKLTNASQANSVVASQAFKNECRKLKDEKTKVIAALGQDIWDDCLK